MKRHARPRVNAFVAMGMCKQALEAPPEEILEALLFTLAELAVSASRDDRRSLAKGFTMLASTCGFMRACGASALAAQKMICATQLSGLCVSCGKSESCLQNSVVGTRLVPFGRSSRCTAQFNEGDHRCIQLNVENRKLQVSLPSTHGWTTKIAFCSMSCFEKHVSVIKHAKTCCETKRKLCVSNHVHWRFNWNRMQPDAGFATGAASAAAGGPAAVNDDLSASTDSDPDNDEVEEERLGSYNVKFNMTRHEDWLADRDKAVFDAYARASKAVRARAVVVRPFDLSFKLTNALINPEMRRCLQRRLAETATRNAEALDEAACLSGFDVETATERARSWSVSKNTWLNAASCEFFVAGGGSYEASDVASLATLLKDTSSLFPNAAGHLAGEVAYARVASKTPLVDVSKLLLSVDGACVRATAVQLFRHKSEPSQVGAVLVLDVVDGSAWRGQEGAYARTVVSLEKMMAMAEREPDSAFAEGLRRAYAEVAAGEGDLVPDQRATGFYGERRRSQQVARRAFNHLAGVVGNVRPAVELAAASLRPGSLTEFVRTASGDRLRRRTSRDSQCCHAFRLPFDRARYIGCSECTRG